MNSTRLGPSSRTVKLFLAATALGAALAVGCTNGDGYDLSGGNGGSGGGGTSSGTNSGSGSGSGAGSTGTTSSGGQGGEAPQPANFELSFDNAAPSMELRADEEITLDIEPNGYMGPVELTLEGLPGDVTGQLDDTTLDLDGSSVASTVLHFTTLSSTVTGAFDVTVSGTVETGTKKAVATLTVIPTITIYIPMGLNGMQGSSGNPNTTAFGDFPTMIKALPNMSAQNPITVRFFNGDSVPHRIHAGQDGEGFPHGDSDIQPGQFENPAREVNTPDTYTYYPHDINNTILGRITIQ